MQYKPIVPQNIPIVITYVYSLNSGHSLKCCSETISCSKELTLQKIYVKYIILNSQSSAWLYFLR